ncbi:hypothetical protein MRX96_001222 [Rhipicephalus microplus]
MFTSAEDVYARLQQVKTILANKGADLMAPCGKQNLQDCDLIKHVGAWNDILAAIPVHIEEVVESRMLAVSFPVKMSDQLETRQRIERAVVLLYRLFVGHTCVQTIVLDDVNQFCSEDQFKLLCHGISKCQALNTLRVNAVMDEASYYQKLLIKCLDLKHLEELRFEAIDDSENTGNMAILAAVIEHNTRLVTFNVNWFSRETRYMSALLQALQRRQTLSHLSLDCTSFNENESTLFLNILRGNNVFKSLRLRSALSHNYITVNSIAFALSNSTTLVSLELLGFPLSTVHMWALAMGLAHVRTMETLIVEKCIPVLSFTDGHMHVEANGSWVRVSSRIVPYIYIIYWLPRLRCFAFNLLHFSSEDQRAFLQVLAATASPIHVFATAETRGYPCVLSRIATETGTSSRIHLSPVCMNEVELANLPTECRVGAVVLEVEHGTWNNENPYLNACLTGMRTIDHVVSFTLDMKGRFMVLSTAEVLARYLEATKVLEAVTLDFSASKESNMLLLHGLSRNSSITSLGVECWCCTKRSAKFLADIVSSSKVIHALTYNEKSMAPSKTFFSRLSKSIAGNFTIVSMKTFERRENAKNWAFIQNVTTRNVILLERGARFVACQWFQKNNAEAFEAVTSSPLLPLRVQMLTGVDECEAVSLVQKAVRFLRDMDVFMSITGVANAGVVCEESSDGWARLDSLPADCWLAIRRYLSVADVVRPEPNSS